MFAIISPILTNHDCSLFLVCLSVCLHDRGSRRVFELLRDLFTSSLTQWLPDNLPMDEPPWFQLTNH
jgi:hypothetical protein